MACPRVRLLRQIPREIGYPVFIKQVASVPHVPGGTAISYATDMPAGRVGQTCMRRADDQRTAPGESCSCGPCLPPIVRDKDSIVSTDVEVLPVHRIKGYAIDTSSGAGRPWAGYRTPRLPIVRRAIEPFHRGDVHQPTIIRRDGERVDPCVRWESLAANRMVFYAPTLKPLEGVSEAYVYELC